MDRRRFYDAVRAKPFGGSLSADQVSGMSAILDEWDRRGLKDFRWLAYMLATTIHETARTMQPIGEFGRGKGRKYGVKGKHGQVAYGRGYVQLTWDYNYERADKELGLNGALTRNYELALRPDIAAQIMFEGMIDGWFTGKKLSTYFTDAKADWKNARRIINGVDKADLIAGYGRAFLDALKAAESEPEVIQAVRPPPDISASEPPPQASQRVPDAVMDDNGEDDPVLVPAAPASQPSGWARILQAFLNAVFRRR